MSNHWYRAAEHRISVAGVTHPNSDGTSRQAILRKLMRTADVEFELVRDPENAYGSAAIAVLSTCGQIGFIPADYSQEWSPQIDTASALFTCGYYKIQEFEPEDGRKILTLKLDVHEWHYDVKPRMSHSQPPPHRRFAGSAQPMIHERGAARSKSGSPHGTVPTRPIRATSARVPGAGGRWSRNADTTKLVLTGVGIVALGIWLVGQNANQPVVIQPVQQQPAPPVRHAVKLNPPAKPKMQLAEDQWQDDAPPPIHPDRNLPEVVATEDPEPVSGKEKRGRAKRDVHEVTPESRAAARLRSAKSLLREGKTNEARKWLQRIVDEEPDTHAAIEAAELLKK